MPNESAQNPTNNKAKAPAKPNSRAPLVILLSCAAFAAAIWLWADYIEDRVIPRNFSTVSENHVYRAGRQTPPTLSRIITKHNIKTVVDLGGYPNHSQREQRMVDVAESLGASRTELRLHGDATGNPNAYVEALRIIANKDNHPVLVHCAAGSERTGATIAMYQHLYEDVPLIDALPNALNNRHEIKSNPRMFQYVVNNIDAIKRALDTNTWVPGYPAPGETQDWGLQREPTTPTP